MEIEQSDKLPDVKFVVVIPVFLTKAKSMTDATATSIQLQLMFLHLEHITVSPNESWNSITSNISRNFVFF